MKIVVNDGYYGYKFTIPDSVREAIGFTPNSEELREDETLIKIVEETHPVGLKVIDIPDEATDWVVISNRVTDQEEVLYVLDGCIFVKQ